MGYHVTVRSNWQNGDREMQIGLKVIMQHELKINVVSYNTILPKWINKAGHVQ